MLSFKYLTLGSLVLGDREGLRARVGWAGAQWTESNNVGRGTASAAATLLKSNVVGAAKREGSPWRGFGNVDSDDATLNPWAAEIVAAVWRRLQDDGSFGPKFAEVPI
jgi:hypothetical protein